MVASWRPVPGNSSTPPTARVRLSGEKATAVTSFGKASDWTSVPLCQSQILAVKSREAEARAVPSGEKARLRTNSPSAKLMNFDSPEIVSTLIAGGKGVGLGGTGVGGTWVAVAACGEAVSVGGGRSEERRGGKGWRCGWW